MHLVASLLKRWINGTLQHNVSHEHLGYYLDEYAFRFNRRNSRARGMLFYRLLQQAAAPTRTHSPNCTQADKQNTCSKPVNGGANSSDQFRRGGTGRNRHPLRAPPGPHPTPGHRWEPHPTTKPDGRASSLVAASREATQAQPQPIKGKRLSADRTASSSGAL